MLTNLLTFFFEKCLGRELIHEKILLFGNVNKSVNKFDFDLKVIFYTLLSIMIIDQIWVEENIDEIMKIFCKINPQFNVTDNASHRASKSRHKRQILEDMDKIAYRPIYYIARRNKDHLELKHEMNSLRREIDELETINHANAENLREEKEKSRKLAEENSMLKSQNKRLLAKIAELEKNLIST